ncbi:MAG: type 1 glutamine amidotransferase [Myxococcota bacterium]
MRLHVLDVNVIAGGSTGCIEIGERLVSLEPNLTITYTHWRDYIDTKAHAGAPPDATILGPNSTPFAAYPEDFSAFLRWVREYCGPLLGICGGHQVLALAHGATVAPVHDVPAATTSYRGMPKISGRTLINLTHRGHPLLADLPSAVTLTASHVDEVQSLPIGFECLAHSEACRIQIMAHKVRPQYGIQCHPERPPDDPHGSQLLQNWLALLRAPT